MKTLGFNERTVNVTGETRCRYCADAGFVVVQMRGPYEEMGPCPFCQRGYFEEFGDPEHQTKAPGITPPWRDGFWKGRPPTGIVALEAEDSRPLPPEENARRMRALMASLSGVVRDVDFEKKEAA